MTDPAKNSFLRKDDGSVFRLETGQSASARIRSEHGIQSNIVIGEAAGNTGSTPPGSGEADDGKTLTAANGDRVTLYYLKTALTPSQ